MMGFSTILDILGSTFIGGMLLIILFRLNDSAAENIYNNSGELASQQNILTLVQIIEDDFRKIGYCKDWQKIPIPSQAIVMADSNKIKFLTDVNNDSSVDSILYYTGSTDELLSTPNPRDRYLYRIINNEPPVKVNLGVTEFKLEYYDIFDKKISFPVNVPGEIHSIQIDLAVENVEAYDNRYSSVFWRQIRLAAQNLKNR